MTTIIDYGLGNLTSVEKACRFLGEDVHITSEPNEILKAQRIILPGVGACGDAMNNLRQYGIIDTINQVIQKGVPFLGICLGMQMLFEHSQEGNCEALSVLKGRVKRFTSKDIKIPQIGWNSVNITKESRLFKGIEQDSYFYFVHSFYVTADDNGNVASTTDYGITFHSAVEHENLFAVQFHPEKSGEIGLKMLRNFINTT